VGGDSSSRLRPNTCTAKLMDKAHVLDIHLDVLQVLALVPAAFDRLLILPQEGRRADEAQILLVVAPQA